jgi:type IV pilus assembly protein PilB
MSNDKDSGVHELGNVTFLNAIGKMDTNFEEELEQIVLGEETFLTVEDDLSSEHDQSGITRFLSKYSKNKYITLGQFMDSYTINFSFADEFLQHAGNMDVENESNLFFVVAQLNNDVDSIASQLPRNIIITTSKSRDSKTVYFNSLKQRVENNAGGACDLYISSIADLINMIEAMKEVYNDPNRVRNESADVNIKEETKAKKKFREIVVEALRIGATDIHVYQKSNIAQVKYTVSGLIVDGPELEKTLASRMIVASLMTSSPEYGAMASDNELADARIVDKYDVEVEIPSPNGIEKRTLRESVTLRLGKTPSNYGPHTTMRVLMETEGNKITLDELGYDEDNLKLLKRFLKKPNGILLMTGPTGSGKTTGLAGCYEAIDHNKKIIVLEDPIEIKLTHPNVVQSTVNPEDERKDYNSFLRKALRQAPHVIGISEIRDENVAAYCFRLALTGHLMISTIHTNGSIETIVRLNDLGINYNLMAVQGLLDTIVAQRLLRKLCDHCKIPYFDEHPLLGNIYKANHEGCEHCNQGYNGRVIVSEVFVFDAKIRELVTLPDNTNQIRKYLKSKGWKSMADRALIKVRAGIIDVAWAQSIPQFLDVEEEVDYQNI